MTDHLNYNLHTVKALELYLIYTDCLQIQTLDGVAKSLEDLDQSEC